MTYKKFTKTCLINQLRWDIKKKLGWIHAKQEKGSSNQRNVHKGWDKKMTNVWNIHDLEIQYKSAYTVSCRQHFVYATVHMLFYEGFFLMQLYKSIYSHIHVICVLFI